MAGFGARPEVVSELPHFMPSTRWLMGKGSRRAAEASRTSSWASRMPAAVVRAAPPTSCTTRCSTRLPLARMPSITPERSVLSQPRLIRSTEWRLGLTPEPDQGLVDQADVKRASGQQPWWWVKRAVPCT